MNRQLVTGIIVNEKPNVNRDFIKKVRAILKNWEVGGEEYAQKVFKSKYEKHIKGEPSFKNVSRGYIDFIGLVRGKEDAIYLKLLQTHTYLNNQINYNFITHDGVRKKLIEDNKKMEMIPFSLYSEEEERFIDFCTVTFHQVEHLINYFYWRRFNKIEDLIRLLITDNPFYSEDKFQNYKKNYKKVSSFSINVLQYSFDKQFNFKQGIFYDNTITKLRKIRNTASHRCEVDTKAKESIISDYEPINKKHKAYFKEHKEYISTDEIPQKDKDIINQFELLTFVESRNYNIVRKALFDVVSNIKSFVF